MPNSLNHANPTPPSDLQKGGQLGMTTQIWHRGQWKPHDFDSDDDGKDRNDDGDTNDSEDENDDNDADDDHDDGVDLINLD